LQTNKQTKPSAIGESKAKKTKFCLLSVIANKNNKQIVFSTLQESVLDSLKDENYKKSLVEVNSSILKIREMNQNKEQVNKPKM
jgi:hypothetical protein